MIKRKNIFMILAMAFALAFLFAGSMFFSSQTKITAYATVDEHSHSGWTEWTSTNSLPSSAGNYYLSNDITINIQPVSDPSIINYSGGKPMIGVGWAVPNGTTKLCLNGKTVTINPGQLDNHYMMGGPHFSYHTSIKIDSGANLYLYDENGSGRIATELYIFINGGSLTLNDGTLNSVRVDNGGSFTMNGGVISAVNTELGDPNNSIDDANCGVRVVRDSYFTMNGGTIRDCGNIGVESISNNVVINNGLITNNKIGVKGTMTLVDGTISYNTQAGIEAGRDSNITMNGGRVSYNQQYGVNITGGTFNMNGGEVVYNAKHGVYITHDIYWGNKGAFNMNGGDIFLNDECGVYSEQSFVMTGGHIVRNKKGVYAANGTVKLSGNATINFNSLILTPKVRTIEIAGALTTGANIKVALVDNNNELTYGVFTNSTNVNSSDYINYFSCESDSICGLRANGTELEIYIKPHSHFGNDDYYVWESTDSLPTEEGNYFLWSDVTLTQTWTIPDNTIIRLCLNDHKILGVGIDEAVICVNGSNAMLQFVDEWGTGKIITENENCESVIKVIGGTLIINNCIIEGNAKNGLTLIENSYAIIYSDCYISGMREHGIRVDNSYLRIFGITLTNNGKYGVYANSPRLLQIWGGTITENLEGGVYSNRDVEIEDNPVIFGNGASAPRNLVLSDIYKKVKINYLTEGANIGLTFLDANFNPTFAVGYNRFTTFSNTYTAPNYAEQYIGYFTSDEPSFRIIIQDKNLKIVKFNNIVVLDVENGSVNAPAEAEVGTNVTVDIIRGAGYQFSDLSVTSSGKEIGVAVVNPRLTYSFIMPNGDVTISARFEVNDVVVYQKWDTTLNQFVSVELTENYTLLSNDSTITNNEIGTGATNPSEWIVVEGDNVDFGEKILKVIGDVNLILKDGCYIQVRGAFSVSAGNSLTIYAQSQGTGRLFARNQTGGYSAIGGQQGADCGTITIHGGNIVAQGADTGIGGSGTGHNGGNVTIYGGYIEASGMYAGIGASKEGTSHGILTIPEEYIVFGGESNTGSDILESPFTTRYKYMKIQKLTNIDVSANDVAVEYLSEAPEFKYTATINGNVVSNEYLLNAIAGKIALVCDYVNGNNAGEYAIANSIESYNYPFVINFNGYKIHFTNGLLTVNKIAPSITTAPTTVGSLVYTGEAQQLVVGGEADGGRIYYKVNYGEYSSEIPTATLAGTYIVYYKVIGDQNHIDSNEESIERTIAKANLIDVSVKQNGTLTYNTSIQTPVIKTLATSVGEQEIVFTYSTEQAGTYSAIIPAFIDAGKYTIYFKVNAENHNEVKGNFEVIVEKSDTIFMKAPVAKEGLTFKNLSQELITAGLTNTGLLLYKLGDGDYDTTIPSATTVGDYVVFYKVIGDQNYNDIEETMIFVSISENDKTELNDVIDSATDYYNSINGEYAEIAESLNIEIAKANQVKNNKNVTEDKIESTYIRLYLKFNDTKIEVLDAKVNVIIAKIDAIGSVENTLECKAKIDDARSEYNTLATNQKSKVTNYQTLLNAESAYANLQMAPAETSKAQTSAVGIVAIVLSSLAILGMIGYVIFYYASRKKKLIK